jgi:long-chain acyl-CoA synthetase
MSAKAMDPAIAARCGMVSSVYASLKPDRPALITNDEVRSFRQLHENANRLANALLAGGLRPGDGLATLCGNGATYVETLLAAMRIGLRLTPVNWHLSPNEAAYIVADCDARALIAEAQFAETAAAASTGSTLSVRLAAGGALPGFADYATTLAKAPPEDPDEPQHGTFMLYTSGTTGRPKGVFKALPEPVLPQGPGTFAAYDPEEDVQLCAGPGYHAAPLLFDLRWPLASGVPIVMMRKWDAQDALRLIASHRITHAHMAPTMFQRLLQLPDSVRAAYDTSSLKFIVHGAAPCPVEVKRAMIDWLGPVITEYYAATEGGGGFQIGSEEWLRKPGSVGRLDPAFGSRIVDEEGRDCPPGVVGRVFLRAPAEGRFSYYKAPAKTLEMFEGDHFTLGDMGYADDDGYLFLTGRSAELIISGGVNIYPQEIDNVLSQHPAIADVCCVGVPDEEWGESVRAVVELRGGFERSEAMAAEIRSFARERLSGFKVPKSVDFVDTLPRLASGKVQRGVVRQCYWEGRARAI